MAGYCAIKWRSRRSASSISGRIVRRGWPAGKPAAARAKSAGAGLVVFPELSVIGYPPKDLLLKPHVRTPDQPKTKIDVVYGEAKGRLEVAAQALRSIQLLETVAEHTAEAFVWPAPFTLEMQTCGFPNARWALATRKLTLCYELAADFAELYTTYGTAETRRAVPPPRKRKSK